MDALLTSMVLWLSVNFALPANYSHPKIEFVAISKIRALRYGFLFGSQDESVAAHLEPTSREVVAVYQDQTRTIYLPKGWRGTTAAELSVLVHEMVHHLQKAGNLKFDCPQEREQLAYSAQDRWLKLFGTDLAREFEIDPFTLKVTTACGY
jgi:hypothetical protein